MKYQTDSVEEYIKKLPEERQEKIQRLREEITKNLPEGFKEEMNYGMIGYVVPFSIYPDGYHASPDKPLPFMNIASQKNHIAVYHMGIYATKEIFEWFIEEYLKYTGKKPDMGKSCIRFKNNEDIPYQLIGELAGKISVDDWIEQYEKNIKKNK